jgi:hypothetical protein
MFCKKEIEGNMVAHVHQCEPALLARYQAAVGLAMTLGDVESIKNVLEPLSK